MRGHAPLVLHVHLIDGITTRFLKEADSALAGGIADRVLLAARWRQGLDVEESVAPGVSIWRPRLVTGSLPRSTAFQAVKGIEWKGIVSRWATRARPSIIHCHGPNALMSSVGISAACGASLVYDAHELETEANGLTAFRKQFLKIAERRLIGRAAAVLAVNDAIADWYTREYGIERPAVVRNVPVRPDGPPPESNLLRAKLGIPNGDLVFLYSGALLEGRQVEQFLRVFSQVSEDRHVVFMGYGDLVERVRRAAATRRNIHFLPAVPMNEILDHAAGADIGLVGMENVCLSNYYTLPNKLFEYLLAGVPVAAGDRPELRRLVELHGCGRLVGDTDEDWRQFVTGVSTAELRAMREAAVHARMKYSWQDEATTLLAVYRRVLE